MCGRFAQYRRTGEYAAALGLGAGRQQGDLVARYNIAPSEAPLVARVERAGEVPTIAPMRWGFVPHWARENAKMPQPINARAETVATKPMFRTAFRASRALIPADAYFEWAQEEGKKQPYCFRLKTGEPMFFAGIWASHEGTAGATPTFAIIVGPANELVAKVHDRAPVILPPAAYEQWLDPDNQNVAALNRLLVPCDADDLEAFPVSRDVSNPRNKGPECLEPIGDALSL